jgi:hypothetical protein
MSRFLSCLTIALVVPGTASQAGTKAIEPEVAVYGGTASGVIAAVAAARAGKTVALFEPGQHLGGMVSGGLGATDTGNRAAIGGYSREFFNRVRDFYVKKYGAASPQAKDCSDGFRFEPHVAERIFHEMLKEAKVEVLFGQRVEKVVKTGPRLDSIRTVKGDEFAAAVWIDASYEGDLLARAGVSYTVGREARSQYKEPLAGVQEYSRAHQWPVAVSPFDDQGKLLPLVQPGRAGEGALAAGAGDKKVQAYNFRLCMTQVKDNQVPFPKPPNYDPKRYELLARYLGKKPDLKVAQLMNPVRMPNGKTDTNNNGPFSTDHIGANWAYPDADYAGRERIWEDHVAYVQGFLYFLANDPRVPEALQKEMRSWGLAKDEFTDTGNWPHQLYVREARRMLGEFVMTQTDIMDNRKKPDSVGLGSYNTDSHHVQRVTTKDGAVVNEGDFQVRVLPYAISYRSLLPKATECDNLLVPVCLSASHVAYGTIRMEPVYMVLGQASGVAAALAVEGKTSMQKVPVEKLLAKLKEQKAVLDPDAFPQKELPRGIDPAKLAGVVVDDRQAAKTGDWQYSSATTPFVGEGYLHDGNQDKGKRSVRFTPKLPKAGKYEVFLFYPANANRSPKVPVVVHSQDGDKTVTVDQRKPLKDGGGFKLGVFAFAEGEKGYVEVRNEDTDGYVIADAVQFVPMK